MSVLPSFSLPAEQQDFPAGSPEDAALKRQWNTNITGFTYQAILGNPWTSVGASHQTAYFDSLTTDIPQGSTAALIHWISFPNRLNQFLSSNSTPANPYNYSQDQILELADTGGTHTASPPNFENIPKTLCPQADWTGSKEMYGPYGPRGWLDEYCEWSVIRNSDDKITRIDFTCENPEYWNSVWMVSPERVAQLYEETLNYQLPDDQKISCAVEDFYVIDPESGAPLIDPSTGRPAYNPLNKWNSGTVSVRGKGDGNTGGVMHLTSTPNTIQTEMALASGATVQRKMGNSDPQKLICCSVYGQPYRNSDPHIGQRTNQVVSAGNRVALADPTGLYIQKPNLDVINGGPFQLPADPKLPSGATVDDCWQIIRGNEELIDPVTGLPYGKKQKDDPPVGNFILHAVFQIPAAWVEAGVSFSIGDIQYAAEPKKTIQWGGEVAQQMSIGLWARPIPSEAPAAEDCVKDLTPPFAQPLQMFHKDIWYGFYGTSIPNPMNQSMNLASNSTMIAPIARAGSENISMVLTCLDVKLGPDGQQPSITFPDGNGEDIVAENVTLSTQDFQYAVPGNSYPGSVQVINFDLKIAPDAKGGLRSLQLTNFGETEAPPIPAFLNVVS